MEIVMRVNVNVDIDDGDSIKVVSCIALSQGKKQIMSSTSERKMLHDKWNGYEESEVKKVVMKDVEYFQSLALEMIHDAYKEVEDDEQA